jgi:hypothetical protein
MRAFRPYPREHATAGEYANSPGLTIGASAAARSERSEAERCRLNARVSRPALPDSRLQRTELGLAARRPFSGPERSFFGPANDLRLSRCAAGAQRRRRSRLKARVSLPFL